MIASAAQLTAYRSLGELPRKAARISHVSDASAGACHTKWSSAALIA